MVWYLRRSGQRSGLAVRIQELGVLGFRVQGSVLGFQGVGCVGFKVRACGISDLGSRIQGSGFRVQGLGLSSNFGLETGWCVISAQLLSSSIARAPPSTHMITTIEPVRFHPEQSAHSDSSWRHAF